MGCNLNVRFTFWFTFAIYSGLKPDVSHNVGLYYLMFTEYRSIFDKIYFVNRYNLNVMKIFRFLAVALVAMLGFNSCEKSGSGDNEHAADLVGTWTCLTADMAEALVIAADGTVLSTGIEDGEYWENVAGTIKVENSHIEMMFEDDANFEGHFDIIPGAAFSIYADDGERYTFKYCPEDLAEEIVGMWVSTGNTSGSAEDMRIQTFKNDGKSIYTGFSPLVNDFILNDESTYKVIGDLCFQQMSSANLATRLTYSPKGTSMGDIMTFRNTDIINTSWLRINQGLDLADKKYDYSNLYLSNVKGQDKEISFMGYTLNFATMDGSKLDMMLKSTLFNVEFPDANTIKYSYHYGEQKNVTEVPIVVEGNKLTVKMSEMGSALKDVVYYAFQDVDSCQMHLYMHRDAVVDFYTNMQAFLDTWLNNEDVINDAEAVKAIYQSFDEAVETINLSIIFHASSRAL